jgi:hypothetical protein
MMTQCHAAGMPIRSYKTRGRLAVEARLVVKCSGLPRQISHFQICCNICQYAVTVIRPYRNCETLVIKHKFRRCSEYE